MVEPKESGTWRLEVEMRDPQTKVELTTGMFKADPSCRVEPLDEPKG